MTATVTDKSAMEKGQARPQVLLVHHLKALRLPTFLSQYSCRNTKRSPVSAPATASIIRAICSSSPSSS